MAIKSIDDLTAPVGMTEKENQKGLKITVPLEATNQNKEGMDFLATPLVTPTDINPAYNINIDFLQTQVEKLQKDVEMLKDKVRYNGG